jgi:DNA polymerase III delta prime subunit
MLVRPEPRLSEFLENYPGKIKGELISLLEKGNNKFVFEGPPGSGKTFLAEALANYLGGKIEIVNLYLLDNVEDIDQSSLMLSVLSNAAQSKSLFDSSRKVIFVEDIDKLLSVDPGVLTKIREINSAIIIFESRNGEIFRAKNKPYLKGYSIIRFYKPNERVLLSFARRVLALNKTNLSEQSIEKIVKNSRGNLSSIITDLSMAVTLGKEGDVPTRNSEDSVFEQLNGVFFGQTKNINTHFSSDNEAKNFEIWISDKAPQIFWGEGLSQVFEKLSFSDILLNKIKKQNWGLLKYVQNILFSGISLVSPAKRHSITYFAPRWDIYYKT